MSSSPNASSSPVLSRRSTLSLGGALALAAGLTACGGGGEGGGSADTSALAVGYVGAVPAGFDPHDGATGSYQAVFPAYDTLLHVDADGNLQPWLARSWSFTDPTTLEMTLRTGVTFTDGTPFDATAVKANVEHARDIEQGTGFQGFLKAVTDVQVVDPTTVRLVLAAPNPGLPFDFSQNPGEMVSPKALADPTQLASAPVGTGPYVLDAGATRTGTTLAWKRNPDYWAADQDLFPFDTVTYQFGQDPTAIRNAAQAGDLNMLSLNPGDPVPGDFETLKSTSGPNSGFTGIWLDASGTTNPALADVRVRQAINHAIDTKTIAATVYEGAATPVATVPVTEDSAAWSDELAGKYDFDPVEAKRLLTEAGHGDGFTMKVLALPVAEAFAQAIAGNLREVGIDAQITSVAGPDLPKQLFTGTYQAGLLLQRPTGQAGQDLEGLFSENAFYNVHKSSAPQLLQQLEAADALTDATAQETAYQQAAVAAADEAWFAGTIMLQQISAFDADVVAVTPPPYGEIFLYHWTAPK